MKTSFCSMKSVSHCSGSLWNLQVGRILMILPAPPNLLFRLVSDELYVILCLCIPTCIVYLIKSRVLGATMASHEEQNKQGEMMQQRWISRFARERQDLSASIEETLGDYAAQGRQWQGDGEGLEEQSDQDGTGGGSSQKPIIPPQLTLQSKALTVIQTESNADTASHARLVKPSPVARKDGEQPAAQATQNVNALMRLAQRVTSSFAALGNVLRLEPSSVASAHPQTDELYGTEAEEQAPVSQQTALAVTEDQDLVVSDLPPATPLAEVPDRSSAGEPAERASGSTQPMASLPKVQRLVGRTTLVRMEAVSSTPPLTTEHEAHKMLQEDVSGMTSAQLLALDVLRDCQGITSAHLPVLERRREQKEATSAHLPAVNTLTGNVAVARSTLSGSGIFESGQKEVSVPNAHVTASTVVFVMLTNDPGPVVVQYVSLQPQIGFTVHLTAPTAMKVAFNYKVMTGELV